MTITEHKALVAAIPEDLLEGEEIEVSDTGIEWTPDHFREFDLEADPYIINGFSKYARRPFSAAPQNQADKQSMTAVGTRESANPYAGRDKPGVGDSAPGLKRPNDDDVEKIILAAKDSLRRHKLSVGGQMCCVADMFEFHVISETIKWQNSLERRPTT